MDAANDSTAAADQNPTPNPPTAAAPPDDSEAAAAAAGRRPFTSLTQEEADLALARVLQEQPYAAAASGSRCFTTVGGVWLICVFVYFGSAQERAYMMLSARHGGDYAASDGGSYEFDEEGEGSDFEEEEDGDGDGDGEALDEDEEVADADADAAGDPAELDPAQYEDDEAFARALQDAEEREVAGRLMALAGLSDWRVMDHDDDDVDDDDDDDEDEDGDDPQDAWEDVDPDEYSYEELVALGEVVGTESRGLSADTLASLPSITYRAQDKQDGNMEQCVICRVEFEEGESLVALPCKHSYHSECINQWLQLNKVCPMCSAEVPTSQDTRA
uniref:RING-type domain-containing protein n=1 Tax=Oryza meridionalis TaxID=40149 RepID=A0A0E0ENP7_9ORYZ